MAPFHILTEKTRHLTNAQTGIQHQKQQGNIARAHVTLLVVRRLPLSLMYGVVLGSVQQLAQFFLGQGHNRR